jgi:hypothetical protein
MDKLAKRLYWHAIERVAHTYGYAHDDFIVMVMAGVICDCFAIESGDVTTLQLRLIREELAGRYDGCDWDWIGSPKLAEQPTADRLEST